MSRLAYWGVLSGVVALGAVAAPLPSQLPPIPEMPDTFRKEAGAWVGNQPYNELTVQLQWLPGDGWQAGIHPATEPAATRLMMPISQVQQYLEGYVDALQATHDARRVTIVPIKE